MDKEKKITIHISFEPKSNQVTTISRISHSSESSTIRGIIITKFCHFLMINNIP